MPEEVPENPATTEENVPIPISSEVKGKGLFSRLNIFRQIAERRQIKKDILNQAQIDEREAKIRQDLGSLAQNKAYEEQHSADDRARTQIYDELKEMRRLRPDDIHEMACIEVATNANREGRQKTEEEIPEIEARLMKELGITPFQKPPEIPQVPTEEERVA
jgi:hypothetical protein